MIRNISRTKRASPRRDLSTSTRLSRWTYTTTRTVASQERPRKVAQRERPTGTSLDNLTFYELTVPKEEGPRRKVFHPPLSRPKSPRDEGIRGHESFHLCYSLFLLLHHSFYSRHRGYKQSIMLSRLYWPAKRSSFTPVNILAEIFYSLGHVRSSLGRLFRRYLPPISGRSIVVESERRRIGRIYGRSQCSMKSIRYRTVLILWIFFLSINYPLRSVFLSINL